MVLISRVLRRRNGHGQMWIGRGEIIQVVLYLVFVDTKGPVEHRVPAGNSSRQISGPMWDPVSTANKGLSYLINTHARQYRVRSAHLENEGINC
jgi:hypothetical protein